MEKELRQLPLQRQLADHRPPDSFGSFTGWALCRKADRRLTVFGSFLLEEDKTYFGYKPCPTYRGPRYVGGYSDHLPIYIDLKK
ncbi:MAG: hypothetical protein ACLTXP_02895 [Odoribacter splanchnicus]